ncbi:MAG: hypothetical protein RL150_39 [Candidatus Parcubacteria bacterium]
MEASDPRHPQRRDTFFPQLLRWGLILGIFLGTIPTFFWLGALILVFLFFGPSFIGGLITVIIFGGIGLIVSAGLLLSTLQYFILRVPGDSVAGTKYEIGHPEFDTDGIPMLFWYFAGIWAKFPWETVDFETDLTRNLTATSSDIPGNTDGKIALESSDGAPMMVAFSVLPKENLEYLQALYRTGGIDGGKDDPKNKDRTNRDSFIIMLAANQSAQDLSAIFATKKAEEIRGNRAGILQAWVDMYAGYSAKFEARHGIELTTFQIVNIDEDPEIGARRKQLAAVQTDREAANVVLEAYGVTTDTDKWGKPNGMTDRNGKPLVWRAPSRAEMAEALTYVQIVSGEATREIREIRIPSLEGAVGDKNAAGAKAILASLFSGVAGGQSRQQENKGGKKEPQKKPKK